MWLEKVALRKKEVTEYNSIKYCTIKYQRNCRTSVVYRSNNKFVLHPNDIKFNCTSSDNRTIF